MQPPSGQLGAPTRERRLSPLSVPTVFHGVAVVAGIAGLVIAPFVLTSRSAPSHMSGGIVFLVTGAGVLVEGSICLLAPARSVIAYDNSRFEFVARRRRLAVGPGELRSIRCMWVDPNRLLPMLVRTGHGSILVIPLNARGGGPLYLPAISEPYH